MVKFNLTNFFRKLLQTDQLTDHSTNQTAGRFLGKLPFQKGAWNELKWIIWVGSV